MSNETPSADAPRPNDPPIAPRTDRPGRPPLGRVRPKGQYLFRWNSHLQGRDRVEVQVRRDNALVKLAALDYRLKTIADERISLLHELEELRDELWPPMLDCRVARPPAFDEVPIPPARANAIQVNGKHLRWICLVLLARHGQQELRDIHALLHQYGYRIAHHHPVKALADALGFEADRGRAQRVRRGVYALAEGFRPRRGRHGHPGRLDDETIRRFGVSDDARTEDVDGPDAVSADAVDPRTSVDGPAHVDPDIHVDPDQWPEYPGFEPAGGVDRAGLSPSATRRTRSPVITRPRFRTAATRAAPAPRTRSACPTGCGTRPRGPVGVGRCPNGRSGSRS